jgi:hypothetical protein
MAFGLKPRRGFGQDRLSQQLSSKALNRILRPPRLDRLSNIPHSLTTTPSIRRAPNPADLNKIHSQQPYQLIGDLHAAKGNPQEPVRIGMDAIKNNPADIKAVLQNTSGADKVAVMADIIKTGTPDLKDQLKNEVVSSLRGQDLRNASPEDVATVTEAGVDVRESAFPLDVKLRGERSEWHLEGIFAPGLNVLEARGQIFAKDADLGGGHINTRHNHREGTAKNAAILSLAGADVGSENRLSHRNGQPAHLGQLSGLESVAQAFMNGDRILHPQHKTPANMLPSIGGMNGPSFDGMVAG